MLKVSRLTDYATAILVHLQKQQKTQSAEEVSKALFFETPTTSKVLKLLTKAGILSSIRGAAGGYLIANREQSVTLLDVISAIEGPTALTECSKTESHCGQESDCDTRKGWQQVNQEIRDILLKMTIQRMAELNGVSKPDIQIVIRD